MQEWRGLNDDHRALAVFDGGSMLHDWADNNHILAIFVDRTAHVDHTLAGSPRSRPCFRNFSQAISVKRQGTVYLPSKVVIAYHYTYLPDAFSLPTD